MIHGHHRVRDPRLVHDSFLKSPSAAPSFLFNACRRLSSPLAALNWLTGCLLGPNCLVTLACLSKKISTSPRWIAAASAHIAARKPGRAPACVPRIDPSPSRPSIRNYDPAFRAIVARRRRPSRDCCANKRTGDPRLILSPPPSALPPFLPHRSSVSAAAISLVTVDPLSPLLQQRLHRRPRRLSSFFLPGSNTPSPLRSPPHQRRPARSGRSPSP